MRRPSAQDAILVSARKSAHWPAYVVVATVELPVVRDLCPGERVMAGHGHVTPNPNGMKARCGGPGICPECSQEAAIALRPARYPITPRRVAEQAVYRWQFDGLPPSTNGLYLTGSHGKRVLTPVARQWKANAVSIIIGTSVHLRLALEPLALHVRLFPPGKGKARWDTDGKLKLIIDAFAEAFGIDDRSERIPFVSALRMEPDGFARTELAVETYAAWLAKTDESGLWA